VFQQTDFCLGGLELNKLFEGQYMPVIWWSWSSWTITLKEMT